MSPPYLFVLRAALIQVLNFLAVNVLFSTHRQPPPLLSCPHHSDGPVKATTANSLNIPQALKPFQCRRPSQCRKLSPQCNAASPRLNTASDFLKLGRTTILPSCGPAYVVYSTTRGMKESVDNANAWVSGRSTSASHRCLVLNPPFPPRISLYCPAVM
ncbi:hypothetical protein B0H16DRAFT_1548303 [Mycena metata]|uniref:Uncharacterized protein n=1 Tax=Mycena metata TaxID=1033252 RepID=A0AAD7IZ18_9AGAR|nr:hypothetical protein B0H16DRAFT_1548303 [Mycena metata]